MPPVPPMVAWTEFTAPGTAVLSDTGFDEADLDFLWCKYSRYFPGMRKGRRHTERIQVRFSCDDSPACERVLLPQAYFYLMFVYLHQYPRVRSMPRVLWTKKFGSMCVCIPS